MEGKIMTDISVLAFFILLIAFRRYLFTEKVLKFLRKNWFWIGLLLFGIAIVVVPDKPSSYQEFIVIICAFFIVHFFLYRYFSVNISLLRSRRGLWKKWQIIYVPIISLIPIYFAYDYFTTEPYHSLDIIIFVFFLGFVIYVSHFLLKETFFSKGE